MSFTSPIPLLTYFAVTRKSQASLAAAGFELHIAKDDAERAALVAQHGKTARAVLTRGSQGITAEEIAAMPKLEIVCAMGVGYENIDLAAARARGIVVTNSPGANDTTVADHAMALLLGVVRDIPRADAMVRQGQWRAYGEQRPLLTGKRLGILGLGTIGMQIAKRAAAGFDMDVAYHNRNRRADVPYRYMPSLMEMAEWCDVLMLATPGGAATRHLVNADVLKALGPRGYLVNIARGSVLDTAALVEAIQGNAIAGAALDVIDGEPEVPVEVMALPRLILTPHMAGRSPESLMAMTGMVVANLVAHFEGRAVPNPVPEA